MIQVTRLENSVLFEFSENQHYLYNGSIEVPYNTLSIIQDGSDMITLRKSASNDIFLSARYNDFGEGSVDAAVDMLADSLFNAEGGGGGISSGEVQTMIDDALDDYYTDDEVDVALSGKASVSDVTALQNEVATKADTSAVTAVANDVQTVSGQVATKVDESDFSTHTANTDIHVSSQEKNDWNNKLDADDLAPYWTSAETQNAIDAATSGIPSSQVIEQLRTDVNSLSGDVADINDAIAELDDKEQVIASALTQLRDDMDEKEEVVASALNDLQENKADTSAVTAVNDALTAHTSDTGIHVTSQEKDAWNAKQDTLSAGTGINISGNVISVTGGGGGGNNVIEVTQAQYDALEQAGTLDLTALYVITDASPVSITVDSSLNSGSTNPVANSAITTAIDATKVYYIDFVQLTTQGIHDSDWDGMVAAINAHRAIYAGMGERYYTAECLYQNGGNSITMTASDELNHYFYTFTKNSSENYTFTSETKPYVTDAEKTAWNAKAEPYSAGTGIEISGNVISATGGGGATYSAGTNISIDTANTINCTLPITANTSNLQGYLLFGSNISVWGSESNGRYQIAIGKQISNPAYAQGQVAICPADTSSASNSVLTGEYPIGIGHKITSRGNGAVAIGDRANANGNNYVAIGRQVDATGSTKTNINNQIKVDTNNQVYIKDKTNTTDVCIQDAIAALGGLKLVKLTQNEYDQLATKDPDTLYIITNVVS